ncbi:hypothetical protein GCM10020331_103410 [Ectobacillus funiculus]
MRTHLKIRSEKNKKTYSNSRSTSRDMRGDMGYFLWGHDGDITQKNRGTQWGHLCYFFVYPGFCQALPDFTPLVGTKKPLMLF